MNRHRRQSASGRTAHAHAARAHTIVGRAARRLGRVLPATAIGALILGPGTASAAREVDLQETGYLHAVGEPGDMIVEQGHAAGTYDCAISIKLVIGAADHVTATFTVKPKSGSVTGRGLARFVQQGADGYFGGTISITGGTGSFSHAAGADIGISGVVNRETFALTVHVHGKIDV